jgi:hypothetical protein
MITGFNNDIKHRGVVYHVQTEDKGEASAWIESLIYIGGRILARKRATYKQLLDEGADRPAIAKLMERQHRLMIQQIREGRFDDEGAAGGRPPETPVVPDDSDIATARMQQQARAMFGPPTDDADLLEDFAAGEAALQERPDRKIPAAADRPAEQPAAAVSPEEAVGPEDAATPTLDQVIFDYLASVALEECLVLLMDESPALASATPTQMDLGTHASRSGKPIAGAQIAVRMISKTGGPITLAEGTTDAEGTLQLIVEVPQVPPESAALIITAASSIGSAEIKHLL